MVLIKLQFDAKTLQIGNYFIKEYHGADSFKNLSKVLSRRRQPNCSDQDRLKKWRQLGPGGPPVTL